MKFRKMVLTNLPAGQWRHRHRGQTCGHSVGGEDGTNRERVAWRHIHRHVQNTSVSQSVQSFSRVWLFSSLWIAACQAFLSITNSRSLFKPMPIESVMPSSHLILSCPLLLLPPIPPSIRVFSSKSTIRMRWPKDWSFSWSISPSNEHPGLISFRMD